MTIIKIREDFTNHLWILGFRIHKFSFWLELRGTKPIKPIFNHDKYHWAFYWWIVNVNYEYFLMR